MSSVAPTSRTMAELCESPTSLPPLYPSFPLPLYLSPTSIPLFPLASLPLFRSSSRPPFTSLPLFPSTALPLYRFVLVCMSLPLYLSPPLRPCVHVSTSLSLYRFVFMCMSLPLYLSTASSLCACPYLSTSPPLRPCVHVPTSCIPFPTCAERCPLPHHHSDD